MRSVLTFTTLVLVLGIVAWSVFGDSKNHTGPVAAATDSSPMSTSTSFILLGETALRLIGPVAEVQEVETGLAFQARVDTGARRCSLHVAEWFVEDDSPTMTENVGKTIRFRLENRQGDSSWLERKIVEVALITTSEDEEMRYLVPLKLHLDGVDRQVLVSLNDRSKMSYPMLLGRNYLAGEFVVDVTEAQREFLVSSP